MSLAASAHMTALGKRYDTHAANAANAANAATDAVIAAVIIGGKSCSRRHLMRLDVSVLTLHFFDALDGNSISEQSLELKIYYIVKS